MSVVSVLTTATVLVLGYRAGRTHAAWRDVRDAKRSVGSSRRNAWRHTLTVALGTAALLVALAAAGYDLSQS